MKFLIELEQNHMQFVSTLFQKIEAKGLRSDKRRN